MQRFAIYGRVKAFVNRKELSAWIESFLLEINTGYKSFSVSQLLSPSCSWSVAGRVMIIDLLWGQTSEHEDLEEAEWVPAYKQAKQCDKKDAWEVRLKHGPRYRKHDLMTNLYT